MLTWDFIQILFSVSLIIFSDLFHRLLVWFLLSSTDCWISVLTHNCKSVLPYTTTYIKIPKILTCSAKTEGQKKQLSVLSPAFCQKLFVWPLCSSEPNHSQSSRFYIAKRASDLESGALQCSLCALHCFVGKVPRAVSLGWRWGLCVCLWLPGLQK